MHSNLVQIEPGSWLGIFGGGQLGRMFTHAAQSRGYHVAVLESEPGCPAAQAADRHFCPADSNDHVLELVESFAQQCSAITLEFENVPADWLRIAERHTVTRPHSEFLEICQHRVREKTSLQSAGFPVTPFVGVASVEALVAAGSILGWPMIVKTSRSGYDGKGQAVAENAVSAADAWTRLGIQGTSADGLDMAIAEQRIDYVAEVSMLGARNAAGQIVVYPLIENQHRHHILDISRCPVSPELIKFEADAREIVQGIASTFQVEGLFCVEFFVDARRGLLINEIAPRPHNSGHLTIEAFASSQFDQQLRAMTNMPLGVCQEHRPAAMANLLGDLWFRGDEPRSLHWSSVLAAPKAALHLYGKAQPRPGRKMGHLTCLADSAEQAVETVRDLRTSLIRD